MGFLKLNRFEISIDEGEVVQGRARRYDVTILFADSLDEKGRQRLLSFLKGLGAGRIEEGTETIAKRA